jgi:hypothetical protein
MDKSPMRILVTIKPRALVWDEAWENTERTITRVLKFLKHDRLISAEADHKYDSSDCRFLAVERWDAKIFIVFDLFNTDYDYLTAHLPSKNDELPMIHVRISKGSDGDIFRKNTVPQVELMSEELRRLHDHQGWVPPPYKEDHANGTHPVYWNPRSLVYNK